MGRFKLGLCPQARFDLIILAYELHGSSQVEKQLNLNLFAISTHNGENYGLFTNPVKPTLQENIKWYPQTIRAQLAGKINLFTSSPLLAHDLTASKTLFKNLGN